MAREYLSLTELYERLRSELPGLDLADLGAHVRTNGFPRERRKGRLHYGLTDADLAELRARFAPAQPAPPSAAALEPPAAPLVIPAPAQPAPAPALPAPQPQAPPAIESPPDSPAAAPEPAHPAFEG